MVLRRNSSLSLKRDIVCKNATLSPLSGRGCVIKRPRRLSCSLTVLNVRPEGTRGGGGEVWQAQTSTSGFRIALPQFLGDKLLRLAFGAGFVSEALGLRLAGRSQPAETHRGGISGD